MKRARVTPWCAVATAFEKVEPRPAVPAHYRALLIRRAGRRWTRCDLVCAIPTPGILLVFRCAHEHKTPFDALECAWQARGVEGYTHTDPVNWGDPPDEDRAP